VQADLQKFCFVKNLDKIPKYLGKEASTFFNNINEIILLCY